MKIEKEFRKEINFDEALIQKCKIGKWKDWRRIYILENEEKIQFVSLTFFDRIARCLLKTLCLEYFRIRLKNKNIRVISPEELKNTPKKMVELVKPLEAPPVEEVLQKNNVKIEPKKKNELLQQKQEDQKPKNHIIIEEKKPQKMPEPPPVIKKPIEKKQDDPRVEKNEMSANQIISMIMLGGVKNKQEPDLQHFDKLISSFDEFCLNKDIQANKDPNVIFITVGQCNIKNNEELNDFVRYLVLKDKIYGFSIARCGYRLDLKTPGKKLDETLFTKEHLIKINDYMQKLKLLKKDDFPLNIQEFIDKILNRIEEIHYERIANDFPNKVVEVDGYVAEDWEKIQALDTLIKNSCISSWNLISRGDKIVVKIKETDKQHDDPMTYKWKIWRNLETVQQEEAFNKANQINISKEDENKLWNELSDSNYKALEKLIKKLNQRTKKGPIEWLAGDFSSSSKILEPLKQLGYIYDYEISLNQYKISVKMTDKE